MVIDMLIAVKHPQTGCQLPFRVPDSADAMICVVKSDQAVPLYP